MARVVKQFCIVFWLKSAQTLAEIKLDSYQKKRQRKVINNLRNSWQWQFFAIESSVVNSDKLYCAQYIINYIINEMQICVWKKL